MTVFRDGSFNRKSAAYLMPRLRGHDTEMKMERRDTTSRRFRLPLAEHLVELAAGIAAAELGKRALLRHLLRGAHEAAPGGACQRTADADPADAEIGGFLQRQAGAANQQVERLRMNRLHHSGDVLARLQARRVEAVGAGVGIRGEPVNDELEVGHAPEIRLAAADQQRAAVADRLAGRPDALDRERAIVDRLVLVTGGILDREARDAGAHAAPDIFRDLIRLD